MALVSAAHGASRERLQESLQQMISANAIPGAIVAYVDGSDIEFSSLGTSPIEPESLFEIGSVTKVFTSLLVQRLVESGSLEWSSTVADLLDEPAHAPGSGFDEMTLAALASHRSGLPRLPGNLTPRDGDDPYVDYDASALKDFLRSYRPVDAEPSYAYSNLGVGLLGYLAASAAQATYPDALQQHVLRPLGLAATYPGVAQTPPSRLMVGHSGREAVPHWNFDVLAGAGSMVSSAADMARFVQLNLDSGEHVMASALLAIRRPRAPADSGAEIAYGWHVNSANAAREPIFWHAGGTGGFRSVVAFRPDTGRGIVILANGDSELSNLAVSYLLDLAPERQRRVVSAESLEALVGRYALAPEFILTVTAEGDQLYAQATGQGRNAVYASEEDRFFFEVVDAEIVFARSPDGDVTALTLFQNGREMLAERLADDAQVPGSRFTEQSTSPEALAEYEGRYDLGGVSLDVQVIQDELTVRLSGQPRLPVYAYEEDRFFYRAVDAQLHFQRGADGQVNVVVLYQNGMARPAPKR